MKLLQLSAAQGPEECRMAISIAFKKFLKEAQVLNVSVDILEEQKDALNHHKSILLSLQGEQEQQLANLWSGQFLWVCPSTIRKTIKRKNWYFGGQSFNTKTNNFNGEIIFHRMRSSGPGGQHVNKTESAIRATHVETGISVKVSTSRSQHHNKKLAIALIEKRLQDQKNENDSSTAFELRTQHWHLKRGDPNRTFVGLGFKEK